MAKKVKPPILPNRLWICAYHTHNMVGSIAHVSSGEKFYLTRWKAGLAWEIGNNTDQSLSVIPYKLIKT